MRTVLAAVAVVLGLLSGCVARTQQAADQPAFVAELIKGHGRTEAAQFAALWGALSAALFTLIGYIRYKRNPACWLPRSK